MGPNIHSHLLHTSVLIRKVVTKSCTITGLCFSLALSPKFTLLLTKNSYNPSGVKCKEHWGRHLGGTSEPPWCLLLYWEVTLCQLHLLFVDTCQITLAFNLAINLITKPFNLNHPCCSRLPTL